MRVIRKKRPLSFWLLGAVFSAFVLFLYGPMFAIFVLSFQGPEGGLTFPMRGASLHWFRQLWEGIGVIDIGSDQLDRSLKGLVPDEEVDQLVETIVSRASQAIE